MTSNVQARFPNALYRKMLVPPGKKIDLKRDYDPGFTVKMTKDEASAALAKGIAQLAEFQDKLYAQDRYSLLVLFQALDAAGKDGTIKHVMSGLNPQGCDVHSFKAPSAEELDHDYLWRCVKALPERGRIAGTEGRSMITYAAIFDSFIERDSVVEVIVCHDLGGLAWVVAKDQRLPAMMSCPGDDVLATWPL